jgi:hypothetical protein
VTLYLLDIASYQAGMDLAKAKAAGFSLVNIKTSQGNWYTHTAAKSWADKARQLGMGICTFHWLDSSAAGKAQADIAYRRMREIGGPDGMAHQLDCEDTKKPATQAIMRDYVTRMQDLLGRHIVVYTGDWWWQPRGWTGAALSPYLWAAPNAGYVGTYPGDKSAHWHAGYGGWTDYSILQYAVAPITGAGGGNVSKSAIRDHGVWAALTGTAPKPQAPEERDMAGEFADAMLAYGGTDSGKKVAPEYQLGGKRLGNSGVEQLGELRGELAKVKTQLAEVAARPAPGTVTITRADLVAAVREVLREGVDGVSPAS